MKRRSAREKALQALFQIDVGKIDVDEAYEYVLNDEETDEFLKQLIYGTVSNLSEIDELISQCLDHWKLDRLANVDRNILRMAVYEMKYLDEIPTSVSINEAVEIAKVFGDEKSGSFVNAVLSKVKNVLESNLE